MHDAYFALIPKKDGDATPLGQRPLSVLPIAYRIWASVRMLQLEDWFRSWVPDSVFTVPPENISELIPRARKIEFELCKYLKTRSDSELSKKNGGIIRPKGIFSKHFWLIHLAGLRVLKHKKNLFFHLYLFSFSLSSSLFFFILSLLSSFIFSCLFSSLLFHLLVSSLFLSRSSLFLSSLFSLLASSSLFLSCLLFSCLVLSLSVSVSVWCCVLWCCVVCVDSKTPPCVHSKRPRVCRHHAHMCFNMFAWCRYTRGRFEWTHDGRFVHTHGEQGVIVSSANQNLPT